MLLVFSEAESCALALGRSDAAGVVLIELVFPIHTDFALGELT